MKPFYIKNQMIHICSLTDSPTDLVRHVLDDIDMKNLCEKY